MKKLIKDIKGQTKASIMLGVGATAVEKAGGDAAGLKTLSGYMPTIANIKGAGHTLKLLKRLK